VKNLLSASLLLLALSSPVMADGTSVPYNIGGPHATFNPVIAQYNQAGERFRIEGQSKSSCPMLLGIRNVCVERSATFLFHGANDNSHIVRPWLNNHLLSHFNGKLRAYLVANRYLETLDFHEISGADMIGKFGYRECPAR
jgi:hypothetical protein